MERSRARRQASRPKEQSSALSAAPREPKLSFAAVDRNALDA
jgi:hypothetical protein